MSIQGLPQSHDCAYGREPGFAREIEGTAGDHAIRHALGWLVCGNLAGLYLSLLLLLPSLQLAHWTYGRWVPVHLSAAWIVVVLSDGVVALVRMTILRKGWWREGPR